MVSPKLLQLLLWWQLKWRKDAKHLKSFQPMLTHPLVWSCVTMHPKKVVMTSRELSRGVQTGKHGARVASLPDKCLTGCCFQSHWWYYIPSGLKRRGSPVGASRQPGEVCWSLRGAACTHIHNIHTQMVSMSQHSRRHCSLTLVTPTTWSMKMDNPMNDLWKSKMML